MTALCLVIALPTAFYIAKVAKPWARRGLIVAVLLPLWAGYLVKGYAWKAMLRPASEFGVDTDGGFLAVGVRVHARLRLRRRRPRRSPTCGCRSWSCRSTPGSSGCPPSLLDAAGRPRRQAAAHVPQRDRAAAVPSIAAGSIFTFSLSLGDYIMPRLVTEGKVTLIGNLIDSTLLAPNQPLAAAFTLWPLLIIVVYLLAHAHGRRLREPLRRCGSRSSPG